MSARYYVIAPSGQKFGPADLNLLNQWAAQGRITPSTLIEVEGTGQRIYPQQIPGLQLPMMGGGAGAPGGTPTQVRQGEVMQPGPMGIPTMRDDGSKDALISCICSVLACPLSCVFLPIAGIIYANRAIAKGNQFGHSAKIFAIVMLIVTIGYIIASIVVGVNALESIKTLMYR